MGATTGGPLLGASGHWAPNFHLMGVQALQLRYMGVKGEAGKVKDFGPGVLAGQTAQQDIPRQKGGGYRPPGQQERSY